MPQLRKQTAIRSSALSIEQRTPPGDRQRSNGFVSSILLFLATAQLAGCATYRPAPIEPAAILTDWKSADPKIASTIVKSETSVPTHFSLQDGIVLEEAICAGLFFNPELRRVRAAFDVAVATSETAGMWKDPTLSFDGEQILADVDHRLIWGGQLAVTIPLSGRPSIERSIAQIEAHRQLAVVLGAEIALLTEIELNWIDLATAETRIELLELTIEDLNHLIEASTRFMAAGAINVVEERLLQIGQAHVVEELLNAKAKRSEIRLQMLQLVGLHPGHPWKFNATLPEVDSQFREDGPEADVNALEAITRHPILGEAIAAYAVAEQRLESEIRRQIPDLTLGLGGGREDGQSRIRFGLGLIPLPLWNQNREGISRAEANRAYASAEVTAAIHELTQRRALATANAESARERLVHLLEVLSPLSKLQLEDARRLMSLGQLDLKLLTDALEEYRRVRLEVLEARAEVLRSQCTLSAILGSDPLRSLSPLAKTLDAKTRSLVEQEKAKN